jgi:small GTP-binding protein
MVKKPFIPNLVLVMILQSRIRPLLLQRLWNFPTARCYSINYLTDALKSAQSTPLKPQNTKAAKRDAVDLLAYTNSIITPSRLNDYFHNEAYSKITPKQLTKSQGFWNLAKIELEYTLDRFDLIPDIKYEKLQKERLASFENRDPFNITEYDENVARSRKTFGIKPELLKPLPEILLLGHTNVGKSSLINNLFLNKIEMKTSGAKTDYAFVSRRAGYTKTLNCFNVGKKLRVIDSPGYGEFGEEKQGKVVLDYIAQRHLLRRVYILIDSTFGFRVEDLQIIGHLIDSGVPFEVIFTKVDETISKYMTPVFKRNKTKKLSKNEAVKLIDDTNERIINHYKCLLDDAKIHEIVTLPKILFNNASSNRFINMRYGYKEIRGNMLLSCGLL